MNTTGLSSLFINVHKYFVSVSCKLRAFGSVYTMAIYVKRKHLTLKEKIKLEFYEENICLRGYI